MNSENRCPMKIPSAVIYGVLLFTILSRLLPHPMNVTSVGALSLFAGAFLPLRIAWIAPVTALLVGDAVNGFYGLVVMLFVYAGFAVGTMVGRLMLANKRTIINLAASALISASIFFVLSNFGMWLSGTYPATIDGLISCYIRGIPYFRYSLIGDIFYTFLLFGSYELVRLIIGRQLLFRSR